MLATFTLATTNFASAVSESDTIVNLASTSGIVPGVFLFANREAMKVVGLTGIGNYASVLRGKAATVTRAHSTNETVWIAQGYQLFETDPQGTLSAGAVPLANPHINVMNGTVWVTQGDDDGADVGARTWQQVTTTQSFGALGIRQNVTTTPS